MVKCLAQGHKRRDRPGRDSNPHSDNTSTWVQCTRPLGHDTPLSCNKLAILCHLSSPWHKFNTPSMFYPLKIEEDIPREVKQFHYTSWPDMGLPDSPAPLMKFIHEVKQNEDSSMHGPMVVHCR